MAGTAMFAAISGLRNHQTKLDVIANNIANVSTYGYKAQRISFSEMLYLLSRGATAPTEGGAGGTNPMQLGFGSQIQSIETLVELGPIQNTDKPTDLALTGEGYFVVNDGDRDRYTRAGNFQLDSAGSLITPEGFRVQGYMADNQGEIQRTSGTQNVTLNFGQKIEPKATENVFFRSNLDASSPTYGTAELLQAGTTNLTIAAGTSEPIALLQSAAVDISGLAGVNDGDFTQWTFTINGETIGVNLDGGETQAEVVAAIVDSINNGLAAVPIGGSQTTALPAQSASLTTMAYIDPDDPTRYYIERFIGGTGADIIIDVGTGTPGIDLLSGLADGTTQPIARGSQLAGVHTLTITDASAATLTTVAPVGTGANTPGGTLEFRHADGIATVIIDLTTFADQGSSFANAQALADLINNTTNSPVTASANFDGTITLLQNLTGASNEIEIIQAGTNTGFSVGFTTNGTDATGTDVFNPDDDTLPTRTRTFTHETVQGIASTLTGLGNLVLNETATRPLIPNVTLVAEDDELMAGQAIIQTYDAFQHSVQADVFDSAGNTHNMVTTFTHSGPGLWSYVVTLPDEPQLTLLNSTGTITFGESGLIDAGSTPPPILFTPDGVNTLSILPVFDGQNNPIEGVTQFFGESTTIAKSQDGYGYGILETFSIDSTGAINGIFSNGITRSLAQVAVATFSNPAGLARAGSNTFIETANSGDAQIFLAETGGAGSILSGALEQSNVELANQFTELIMTQRAFQANSRIITTQDELLVEMVNLKR